MRTNENAVSCEIAPLALDMAAVVKANLGTRPNVSSSVKFIQREEGYLILWHGGGWHRVIGSCELPAPTPLFII